MYLIKKIYSYSKRVQNFRKLGTFYGENDPAQHWQKFILERSVTKL